MIAVKHPKLWSASFIMISAILIVVFLFCYNRVNDPKVAFFIDEETIAYNQDFEIDGILVKVKAPSVHKGYSEEYDAYVYQYKIPFDARNIAEEPTCFPAENLQIVSGGRVWYGWPDDSLAHDDNQKTVWGDINPEESTTGVWVIDVIIEELPEEVYQDYSLYYLQDEGQKVFKYRFVQDEEK